MPKSVLNELEAMRENEVAVVITEKPSFFTKIKNILKKIW